MSAIVAIGILAFVGLASSVLLIDGLAATAARQRAGVRSDLARARAEVVTGAIGLAVVLWTAFGMLTHAR